MDKEGLSFKKTGYFSKLICDYIEQDEKIKPLYGRYPEIGNFEAQFLEKKASFSKEHREILSRVLSVQYKEVSTSSKTELNIDKLKESNTFTIVTGHQLNLFTGPLYFLYKIISTINLAKELGDKHPDQHFVPVYWMATEDHDFDEINYFNFKGRKISWNREASGAVGHLTTKDLNEVGQIFANELGTGKNASELKELFQRAYVEHTNLSDATRYLANALFGAYGLVILDADDPDLKRILLPYIKKDFFEHTAFHNVNRTITDIERLDANYGIQVNPREINYFYLTSGFRERIIKKNDRFHINATDRSFSAEELTDEMEAHPERFSPNVIARPLYQEVILPNLCYIGGGGEIAYWLELKAAFEAMKVPFPILLLRNSALVITPKQLGKLEKMNLSIADLFLRQNNLINKKIREISNIEINFSAQKELLEGQFVSMYEMAALTDKSFLGAVKAQEIKQKKGLDRLEKRLLKAQKSKLKDHVVRMTEIQNDLFPKGSLQERELNFSELFLEYSEDLIPILLRELRPLSGDFTILKIE